MAILVNYKTTLIQDYSLINPPVLYLVTRQKERVTKKSMSLNIQQTVDTDHDHGLLPTMVKDSCTGGEKKKKIFLKTWILFILLKLIDLFKIR